MFSAIDERDVLLPKLFRQTVPQRWPGGGKAAVSELVAWSLDQAMFDCQQTAKDSGQQQ